MECKNVKESNKMKEKIIDILQGDPLYAVLRDTPLEETLYTDSYLTDIIEKKFYSTLEVAGWFNITDAQLRYYIKPFEHYIFADMTDTPTTTTLIRLNLPTILRLRMILLLKDQYRVKGIQRLLGIKENGYIVKQQSAATTALAIPDELANKVEVLSNVLQQIIQTGIFHMQQNEETGTMNITINEDYLAQNIKLLTSQSNEQLNEIQERTEKIEKEQEEMQQQIQEIEDRSKVDIAIKIRERQIESNVTNKLRNEALRTFMKKKKWGIFAKLFHSSQFELEKEQFIEAFITQNLQKNLLAEFQKYNDKEN